MAKTKYHYNTHTLKYEKVELGTGKKLVRISGFLSASFVIAVFLIYLAFTFFDSPKEKQLKREISQLNLQYELLQERMKRVDEVLKDLQQRDDNIYRVIFEAEPIPLDVRRAGFGGTNRYGLLEKYNQSAIMIETTKKLDRLAKELYVQSKSYDELIKLAQSKSKMMGSIPGIQPVDSRKLRGAISGFGKRIHPIYKIRKMHGGMDFTAPTGTPVYATGDGVITEAGRDRGYGKRMVINHGYSYKTMYAHLSRFARKRGQRVKRGDLIGYVGSTGSSTGPHLHYEVWRNGKAINPINYYFNDLSPKEYMAMLEMSSQVNQSFD